MLRKYLAGKNVGFSFGIGNVTNSLEGSASVKDLKYLLEAVYASFTELSPDEEAFATSLEMSRTSLKAQESNPLYTFSKNINKASHDNNPLFNLPTLADVDKVNYKSTLDFVKGAMKNAADFTFLFVGNVDVETLKPLLEQYIATLPADANNLTDVKKVTSLLTAKGQIKDEWKEPMQAPATHIYDLLSDTNIPYSIENAKKMEMIGALLRNVYTETLREEEGGTYSPHAFAYMSPVTGEWNLVYTFSTNQAQQERMISRANEELLKLLENGTNAENFNKVKEATLKQYENAVRTNNYWKNNLSLYLRGVNDITNGKTAIENVTLDQMNTFMKNLYNGKNRIQVIMEGVKE